MTRVPLASFQRFRGDDRGTLVTEFAVTMPILLMFLFGMIGMGQLLWFHHIITEGVRDGVRYLSRVPNPSTDPYLSRGKQIAMSGLTSSGGPLFYFWTDASTINVEMLSIDNSGNAFREEGNVPVVRMTATVQVSLPVLGFSLLGLNPSITYTVTDEARYIGA